MKKRAAAIDIGSNTTLFLVGDVDNKGKIEIVDEYQVSNEIGKDVFRNGCLNAETIAGNIDIIRKMKVRASQLGVETVLAAGTSALRNAGNRAELVKAAHDILSLELKIVSGEEEARLSYSGFLSSGIKVGRRIILVDIGGGSSELILGCDDEIERCYSLEAGAVRLMDSFQLGEPPDKKSYRQLYKNIFSYLNTIQEIPQEAELVFSGGTAAALASLNLGLSSYEGSVIEGLVLTEGWIRQIQDKFLSVLLKTRRELLIFDPDRAEVIIGGTAIMLAMMEHFKYKRCRVTHRGLRFGLIREWGMS